MQSFSFRTSGAFKWDQLRSPEKFRNRKRCGRSHTFALYAQRLCLSTNIFVRKNSHTLLISPASHPGAAADLTIHLACVPAAGDQSVLSAPSGLRRTGVTACVSNDQTSSMISTSSSDSAASSTASSASASISSSISTRSSASGSGISLRSAAASSSIWSKNAFS